MIEMITFDPDEAGKLGVKPCTLRDLSSVVVLAGPNGSGKSRFLRLIAPTLSKCKSDGGSIDVLKQRLQSQRDASAPADALAHIQVLIDESRQRGKPEVVFSAGSKGQVIDLSYSERHEIQDPARHALGDVPRLLAGVDQGSFSQVYSAQHAYLRSIARALFNAEHPRLASDREARAAAAKANDFNALLFGLVGSTVEFALKDNEPEPTLFNRPVLPAEWSDGQRLLIAWAICLYQQGVERLVGRVLILDEPERHLHAAACIEVLNGLRRAVGASGQLWLATHSAPIVAHFGSASLYRVSVGTLTYAGSRVDEVIEGLLGGRDARHHFRAFLGEAHASSFVRFAIEALKDASVASFKANDPQGGLLTLALQKSTKQARPLKVLDYFSGVARFAGALRVAFGEAANELIDYHTFDTRDSPEQRKERARNLRALYDEASASQHMHAHATDFMSPNGVDVVVMCNVLHELPVREWGHTFREIQGTLSDDGFLLLMEDQEISIGEMPHAGGFLVMNLDEVRTLFASPAVEDAAPQATPRLTAFAVPRALLSSVSQESTTAAVRRLQVRAQKELREFRAKNEATGVAGRRHAFLAMLHANAALALEDLGAA